MSSAALDPAKPTPPSRTNTVRSRSERAGTCSMRELKAISEQLTSDQARDRVKDLCEDRVVVVGMEIDPNDPDAVVARFVETIAERMRALADGLGLTDEQRSKIREARMPLSPTSHEAQRTQRRELRHQELKALGRWY